MNARQMYNIAKEHGSIYADHVIKQKIRELGSNVFWWEPVVELAILHDGSLHQLFYNRRDCKYIDHNFVEIVQHDGLWMTLEEYNSRFQTSVFEHQQANDEYFSDEENAHLATMTRTLALNEFQSYGYGDRVYRNIGILKDGNDDTSPTIGFEIETNMELGCHIDRQIIAREYLDTRLGHVESDSTVSGVEFDSHIFTWQKLKKVKPLFEKQLANFANAGLCASQGAGLHIHIGRNAFASQEAFAKFYYVINRSSLRRFWTKVARRTSSGANGYADYVDISDNATIEDVRMQIDSNRTKHSISVNQQHPDTYEIRIFQSTLSADVLYGCIELLLNLVEKCNNSEISLFRIFSLLEGDYARKYRDILGSLPGDTAVNFSSFEPLTVERLQSMVSEMLANANTQSAIDLLTRYQNQRSGGAC